MLAGDRQDPGAFDHRQLALRGFRSREPGVVEAVHRLDHRAGGGGKLTHAQQVLVGEEVDLEPALVGVRGLGTPGRQLGVDRLVRRGARLEQEPAGLQVRDVEHRRHIDHLELGGVGLVVLGVPAAGLGVVFDVDGELTVAARGFHESHGSSP